MAAPAGATHVVRPTVQHGQVPGALADWQTLLCVCDMGASINPAAQSFVAGLAPDLSDLQVTDAADVAGPWRRHEVGLFDQTPGAEKLYLSANAAAIASGADTEFRAYRGCTGGPFEDDGSAVISAATQFFCPMGAPAPVPTLEDWAGGTVEWTDGIPLEDGIVGRGVEASNTTISNDTGLALNTGAGSPGYTICLWGEGIAWGGLDSPWGFYGRGDTQRIRIHTGGAGGLAFVNGPLAPLVGLSSVICTYDTDADHVQPYLDGASYEAGAALLYPDMAQVMMIGRDWNSANHYLVGPQDEALVVEGVWTADEIAAYYSMTSDPAAWCVCGAEEALAVASLPALRSATRHRYPMIGLW